MQIHPAIRELLADIEAFQAQTGISVSAFGTRAVNDPGLIPDLQHGRSPSLKTLDRIRAFMEQSTGNFPDNKRRETIADEKQQHPNHHAEHGNR